MHALFIGQTYIDVTFITDQLPTGDDKQLAKDYAVSFGGNAVTAAFACAKLGHAPDLMASMANDWLGRMFLAMAAHYGMFVHPRQVRRSSLSFIMPKDGRRAIVRARDNDYLHPFQELSLDGCQGLHLDGHQADAALFYAKACRNLGILTSLDGGGLRENTDELLRFIDVAVVAERLCEQMGFDDTQMLNYLQKRGCKIGGVTRGEQGMVWFDETGKHRHMPALDVPKQLVIDTNGAGDIFHGAYMAAYLENPSGLWEDHFIKARAASTHAIQHLGNEASLPTWDDIARAMTAFVPKTLS